MKLKKIITFSLLGVVTIGTVIPVTAVTINNHLKQNYKNERFYFDNKKFNSKNELINYAKSIVTENQYKTVDREKWSINYNNETRYFSSVNDVFEFLDNKIIKHTASTSSDLNVNYDGSIDDSDIFYLNLDSNNNDTITLYKGNNDAYFTNETSAKNSYLQIHEAYLFDNILFRTKEELRSYLELNYDSINDSSDKNIVIVSPERNYSQPINYDKFVDNNEYEIEKFSSFINLYSKKYLEIESTNSLGNYDYTYYDAHDIKNNVGNILAYFDNPSFININSNRGKSNYIVDLNIDDSANLYGPYYTEGTSALKNITNPDSWTRVEGTSWNFNDNQVTADLLSSFVDLIIFEDDNSKFPFSIKDIEKETEKYFSFLEEKYNSVYNSIISLFNTMKKGKRYSSFYKLPVLFIKTIEELIYVKAKQDAIEMTRSYYELVAENYDKKLYSIVPSIFLEPKSISKYKKFSFVDLFMIDSKTFDLNTDIESFVDIIMDEYPNFMEFLNFISAPIYFGSYFPNLFQYNKTFVKYVNPKYNFNFNKFQKYFEELWIVFSTNDIDFVEQFIKKIYNENVAIEIDNETLSYLISQICFTKELLCKNIEKNIKDSIQNIINWVPGVDIELGFFNGLSNKFINSIIELYKYNNNSIDYKIFSLLKIIAKLSKPYAINSFKPFKYNEISLFKLGELLSTRITLDINKILTTIAPNWSGINFLFNLLPSSIEINAKWENIFKATTAFSNKVSSLLYKSKEILEGLGKSEEAIKKILGPFKQVFKFIPYVQVASIVLDLLTPKNTKFSYVFESEGTKYIWDGGNETEMLFGIVKISHSNINDMKINNPIEVTKKKIENGYYYNGKIYFDLQTLKRQQLDDILNGRFLYSNSGISIKHSFDNLSNQVYSVKKGFNKVGALNDDDYDLIDDVYKNVVNKDKKYIIENVFTFANGYTFDKNLSIQRNIDNVVEKIKPVKIAMQPILNSDNFPINGDSIPIYKLPGKSWTTTSGLSENTLDNYVIVDPNEDNTTNDDYLETLKDLFYSKFNVETKTILKTDLYKFDKFSSYKTNIDKFFIYEVLLDNGYRKFFNDKSDALIWFLQQCDFKTYDIENNFSEYYYDGQYFNNIETYLNWILSNSEVKYE